MSIWSCPCVNCCITKAVHSLVCVQLVKVGSLMVSARSFSAPGSPAGRETDWSSAGWNESPSSFSARAPHRQGEGLLLPSSSLGPPFWMIFCLCPSCVFGRELLVASVTCCFGGRPCLGRPLLPLPVAIVCDLQPEVSWFQYHSEIPSLAYSS